MQSKTSILSKLKSFLSEKQGSVAMGAGLGILTTVIAIGAATDYSRISHTRNIVADALDAATLSSAKDLSEGATPNAQFRQDFEDFFFANIEIRAKQTDQFTITEFDADPVTGKVTAKVEADLQMAFMGIVGKDKVKIGLQSEVQYKSDEIELAMMLDVTGSMGGSKLTALKAAAKDAIDILIPVGNVANGKIRIGLVPYAGSVNAGTYASTASGSSGSNNGYGNNGYGNNGYGNNGYGNNGYGNNGYGNNGYGNNGYGNNGYGNNGYGNNGNSSACLVERGGQHQYNDTSYLTAAIPTDSRAECPDVAIHPLSKDKDELKSDINSFVAEGSTAGHLGVAWSYYMLSEKWTSLWPTESDPAAYSNKVKKIALLMTDGEFNTFYYGTNGTPYTNNSNSSRAQSSITTAKELCKEMKKDKNGQDGIIIYSIAFDAPTSAQNTLKACASPDEPGNKYYFSADNATELREAFQQIALNIQKLRITR